MNKKIKNRQFKHAYHLEARDDVKDKQGNILVKGRKDTIFVKELIVYEDGTTKDNLRKLVEPKRKYYITKEHYRNHKQKKEHELKSRVNTYSCTQTDLYKETVRRLKGSGFGQKPTKRVMNSDPYIYGTDIHINELIKYKYDTEYCKGEKDLFTSTFFDIETNTDTDTLSLISSVRVNPKDKMNVEIYLFVNNHKDGIDLHSNRSKEIEETIRKEMDAKLPKEFMTGRTFTFIFNYKSHVVNTMDEFWANAHWQGSDFLSAWNSHYDITKMKDQYKKNDIDIATRLTDPTIGEEYIDYKEVIVPKQLVTAGKVSKSIPPHRRWHLFRSPASFYIIDQMATYSYLRITDKSILGGYGLDNVLTREGGLHKMSFPHLKELEGLPKLKWHKDCSTKYPMEYACYNIWDSILCLMLELKNQDLASTLPIFINRSGFEDFSSSTKYVMNDFHFYALDNDRVIGTAVPTERFGDGIGRRGWTVTLPPWPKYGARSVMFNTRIPFLADSTALLVGDDDVTAAYPNAGSFANISKDTTRCELLNITGLENHKKWKNMSVSKIQKMKELNLTLFSGISSHEEYAVWMYDMPDREEFRDLALEEFGQTKKNMDKELSREHIKDIKDTYDNRKVIVVEDDDNIGAYFSRDTKLEDGSTGFDNHLSLLYKHGTDITDKEDYDSMKDTTILKTYETMMSSYLVGDKMKSVDRTINYFREPKDTGLVGKEAITKNSAKPEYRGMKNLNIDSSFQYGNETGVVYTGLKTFSKAKDFGTVANIEAVGSHDAPQLVYGGSARSIGGVDSLDVIYRNIMSNSSIKRVIEDSVDDFIYG